MTALDVEKDSLDSLSREELLEIVQTYADGGIRINFSGKTSARSLARKVRPRVTRQVKKLGHGTHEERAQHLLVEGDNLQTMATLYKHRGQVDFIITDPPYNTGKDFRYNDKWDVDPNDPGIGDLVSALDGTRHTKWMRFMWPRLHMMKQMLKPGGVLAICVDHRELFRLGQLLDEPELFGQKNRIAIINWEKSTAPRSDSGHVSTSTEYILVYAKDIDQARTQGVARSEDDNTRYGNIDNDPEGPWREANLSARTPSADNQYGIQSPFTGEVHYPPGTRSWTHPKRNVQRWLEEWGSPYEVRDVGDGRAPALMLKGCQPGEVADDVAERAQQVLDAGPWPFVWFGREGDGRPRVKTYLGRVRKGKIPVTYWADEEFSIDVLASTSWDYSESGRTNDGVTELNAIIGSGHGFETVKPLKLFSKLIQIWCPPDGLVMDPFAGSGTTGHAVLAMNSQTGCTRRFVLIEQGRPEKGDSYARTLTVDRLRRACTGDWASGAREGSGGGFTFMSLATQVDASALLKMERDEMTDTVISSYFDSNRRKGVGLLPVDTDKYKYLVAKNADGEGFYLIWDGADSNTNFTEEVYEQCAAEAEAEGLKRLYHVYARLNFYQTDNVRFYQIPDRILNDFGLDMRSEPFSEDDA
jgi:adenine-specific DNA-methyltransferase